jgi:glycosyltransferase involved in cell wall biosynthesis
MANSNKTIRVLRIIARTNIGGPAIQVTNLMECLPKTEFEQLLIAGFCQENEMEYLQEREIRFPMRRIKSLGRKVNPFSDLITLYQIRKIIKEFKPDIIHTHTFKAGLLGRSAAWTVSRKIKLVHTFHGHLLHSYFGKFGTKIVIALERALAKITFCLISVGTRVKDDLLANNIGTCQQYKVINPGFIINQSESLPRSSLGLHDEDFICGWFGRITQVKRADRVLEIAKFAKFSTEKRVKFLIVGDGEDRRELETHSQQLSLPVVFLGWQTNVPSLMRACDLIICTSDNEGTPIALIEAQMLGRPVISTKVGSVEETLIPGKTGFTLDFDANEFWQIIQYFTTQKDVYETFSRNSSEFALKHFSLEKFITNHAKLYTAILAIKPVSSP